MRVLVYTDLKPVKGISYSRNHIRGRERGGTFPTHIALGEGRIGWLEGEIDTWIAERAQQRCRTLPSTTAGNATQLSQRSFDFPTGTKTS